LIQKNPHSGEALVSGTVKAIQARILIIEYLQNVSSETVLAHTSLYVQSLKPFR
ncbi:MAG: hypothetical protein EZS28_028388, partial [Streblomastix strix]